MAMGVLPGCPPSIEANCSGNPPAPLWPGGKPLPDSSALSMSGISPPFPPTPFKSGIPSKPLRDCIEEMSISGGSSSGLKAGAANAGSVARGLVILDGFEAVAAVVLLAERGDEAALLMGQQPWTRHSRTRRRPPVTPSVTVSLPCQRFTALTAACPKSLWPVAALSLCRTSDFCQPVCSPPRNLVLASLRSTSPLLCRRICV